MAHLCNKLQLYKNLKQSNFSKLVCLCVQTWCQPAVNQLVTKVGRVFVRYAPCSASGSSSIIKEPWKGGIRPATAMASINTHLNDTLEVNSYFWARPRMHTRESWQLNTLKEHAMSFIISGHLVFCWVGKSIHWLFFAKLSTMIPWFIWIRGEIVFLSLLIPFII